MLTPAKVEMLPTPLEGGVDGNSTSPHSRGVGPTPPEHCSWGKKPNPNTVHYTIPVIGSAQQGKLGVGGSGEPTIEGFPSLSLVWWSCLEVMLKLENVLNVI